MVQLDTNPYLIVTAAIVAFLLLMGFRKKTVGLFDPLNILLIQRITPAFCVVLLCFWEGYEGYFVILFISSLILFLVGLYLFSPTSNEQKLPAQVINIRILIKTSAFVLVTKAAIFVASTGSIPLFSDRGSDSYINFDLENKLGSSFLLGLGLTDLVILVFVFPLIRDKKIKFSVMAMMIFSFLFSLSMGKKSSLMASIFAMALGEYLRIVFLANQKYFFIKFRNVILLLLLAGVWGGWTYARTSGEELDFFSGDVIFLIFNFVMIQMAHPYVLFVDGTLINFFAEYNPNRIIYFFHTLLSPLGFPAFSMSIGPSIHEYLYGEVTGNGINPTFLIEGYVLVGAAVPLYSLFIGIVLGWIRKTILEIKSPTIKVILCSAIFPSLYTLPIDGLLFAKILIVLSILIPIYLIASRVVMHEKRRQSH